MTAYRPTSRRTPILLAMMLAGPVGIHAASPQTPESPPEGGTAPAMVRFYGVDRTGRSAPEDPLISGFALESSASFEPAPRESGTGERIEKGGDTRRPLYPGPAPLSLRLEYPVQRRRNSFRRQYDELRCERHGFFYTTGGRCVVPAWGRTTRIPPDRPDPRLRYMSHGRGPLPPRVR